MRSQRKRSSQLDGLRDVALKLGTEFPPIMIFSTQRPQGSIFYSSAFFSLLCLIGLLISSAAELSAAEGAEAAEPPHKPMPVRASAYLIDLAKIDGAQQLFNADVVIRLEWLDPRLADPTAPPKRQFPLDSIWHPQMVIANLSDVKPIGSYQAQVSPEGLVVVNQRVIGDFTSRFDLHQFPNDVQSVGIHIVARGHTPEDIQFEMADEFIGRADELTIADWMIGEAQMSVKPYVIPTIGAVAGIHLSFSAKRHLNYYIATIFVSAGIIVCMAWMVFWMPPEAINPRISISVTSMLTLIAHRFVVGGDLPRLSYLTQMDYFLLGSTFMVLLGLVGVVVVARTMSRGNPALGLKLNGVFRWLYPIIFLSMVAVLA